MTIQTAWILFALLLVLSAFAAIATFLVARACWTAYRHAQWTRYVLYLLATLGCVAVTISSSAYALIIWGLSYD